MVPPSNTTQVSHVPPLKNEAVESLPVMLLVNAPSYPLYKCVTLNVRLKAELYLVTLEQDTGFNIGSNDVSSDIKVDPDEFSLQRQDPKISPQQCCAEGSLGS